MGSPAGPAQGERDVKPAPRRADTDHMTLLLVPLLLALMAVLLVPRIKAKRAAAGDQPGRFGKRAKKPAAHKFVL